MTPKNRKKGPVVLVGLLTVLAFLALAPNASAAPFCQTESNEDGSTDAECTGTYVNPEGYDCTGTFTKHSNGDEPPASHETYQETCVNADCIEPTATMTAAPPAPKCYATYCTGTRTSNEPGAEVQESCVGTRNGCTGTWDQEGTSSGNPGNWGGDANDWSSGSSNTYPGSCWG